MIRPCGDDLALNGDFVRAVRFDGGQYVASAVDDLLRRVAAELDVGRPVGPLIKNAKFRRSGWTRGYDVDAVDWFLGKLLFPLRQAELAGIGAYPWRDLGEVTQLTRGEVSDLAKHPADREWLASAKHFTEECTNEWNDFGQAPGTHLRWGRVGRGSRELRTLEALTIASLAGYGRFQTASTGGRTFIFGKIRPGPVIITGLRRDPRPQRTGRRWALRQEQA